MTSLQGVAGTLPGYIVYFAAFLLTVGQLTVVLDCLQTKQALRRMAAAVLPFLVGLFSLVVLLDYTFTGLQLGQEQVLRDFERTLLSAPWLAYLFAELAFGVLCWLQIRSLRHYRRTHLSADAIRQTVDTLPTALMICDRKGTVLLANLAMTELCRTLTGRMLSDGLRFQRFLESVSDEDGLVHTSAGETWQFRHSRITLNGISYDQLMASDMTAKYRVTQTLKDSNEHLREVQTRMRSVAAQERRLVAAREVMNARRTVHDRMGGVLLSGKYYLDHPEEVKEEELLRLLQYSNRFLIDEAEQPRPDGDLMEQALRTARQIGVAVEIDGTLPKEANARALIAQAIDQCASNTVRHAGGDRLTVALSETENAITAVFTNNGRAPKGPIMETGGLSVLRRAVEDAGGTMQVQWEPVFRMSLAVEK